MMVMMIRKEEKTREKTKKTTKEVKFWGFTLSVETMIVRMI